VDSVLAEGSTDDEDGDEGTHDHARAVADHHDASAATSGGLKPSTNPASHHNATQHKHLRIPTPPPYISASRYTQVYTSGVQLALTEMLQSQAIRPASAPQTGAGLVAMDAKFREGTAAATQAGIMRITGIMAGAGSMTGVESRTGRGSVTGIAMEAEATCATGHAVPTAGWPDLRHLMAGHLSVRHSRLPLR
jgi:hypothetical protein